MTEAKQIPGTPFMIRRIQEKWFITCGEMRFTEPTEFEHETMEKLETEKWVIIAKLIIHLNKLDRVAEAANKHIDTTLQKKHDKITNNSSL